MGMRFKNPLACNKEELENIVSYLKSKRSYKEDSIKPFRAEIKHYESARETLLQINKILSTNYKTLGEYLLSVLPDENAKQTLIGLLG